MDQIYAKLGGSQVAKFYAFESFFNSKISELLKGKVSSIFMH